VASWVSVANFFINLGLSAVPNGADLETAIDAIITAAGTTPFSVDALLQAIFSVVKASINLADNYYYSATTTQLDNLMDAICTLVVDAVDGNVDALGSDATNIACAAEAVAGLTDCDLGPVGDAIDKLVTDATDKESAQTIVTDAFAIATASVTAGATSGNVSTDVTDAVNKLLNDICALVNACITAAQTANYALIAPAIGAVIVDANAFGSLQY